MQSSNIKRITSLWLSVLMGLTACETAQPTPQPTPAITVFPSPSPAATATHPPTPPPTQIPTPAPSLTPARPERLLSKMTLEQKVGQVMAIGFGATAVIPAVKSLLNELHIGAIVIFEANVESPLQLAQLIRDAQEATKANGDPALIVAVDQEGGSVARLRANVGFTEFPSAMAIAATGDVNNARLAAKAMAGEMTAVGINMNLAPDMDVNNNPANPIIGIRSFGSDPLKVSAFGTAVIETYQGAGMLCVAKHFPGHGDTAIDSHLGLPMIPYDLARLNAIELVPFRAAKDAGIAGIMSAHIFFPAVDDTPDLPGSLSAKVQTGLLRDGLPESLHFDGLAVSDSLEMGALESAGFTTPKAAAQALAAGADLLTFNSTLDVYRDTHALIVSRVKSGEIPQARLDAAVRRVLRAKERFGVLDSALVDMSNIASRVGLSETKQLSQDIAAKSITLVRDAAKQLPLKADTKLAVIETPYAVGLSAAFGTPGVDVGVLQVSEQPQPFEIEQAVNFGEGKTVIVATYDVAINPTQADLVNALLKANLSVIVIATRSPYDALYLKDAPTVVAIYGTPFFGGLAAALRGQVPMLGVLPVTL